jgi:hypothetical protein
VRAIINFFVEYWAVIIVVLILGTSLFLKLKRLWKGNIIEWLIDVCAEMERNLGDGTGFLKLRGAYNEFIATFPIMSKLISFETFSQLVDEALAVLKEKMSVNRKLSDYISGRLESMLLEGVPESEVINSE